MSGVGVPRAGVLRVRAFTRPTPAWAEIFKWGAYVITYGGVSFTLLRAYRKGEQRGDW